MPNKTQTEHVAQLSQYTDPELNLWDRQPWERDQAWLAFVTYRDMGIGRTCDRVATKLQRHVHHIRRYSHENGWKNRIQAYETHIDRIAQKEREEAIKTMAGKHVLAAEYVWRKAIQVIDKTPIEDITIKDAIAMFRAAIPAERQGRLADSAHVPLANLAALYDADMHRVIDDDDEPPLPKIED